MKGLIASVICFIVLGLSFAIKHPRVDVKPAKSIKVIALAPDVDYWKKGFSKTEENKD